MAGFNPPGDSLGLFYCLMPNDVHLIVAADSEMGFVGESVKLSAATRDE